MAKKIYAKDIAMFIANRGFDEAMKNPVGVWNPPPTS